MGKRDGGTEPTTGVVIPSNITDGPFVQFAGDNNDFNEETLDGKQTTHATTLVVYQRRPSAETVRVGVKKLSRVGKGIPDVYRAIRFGGTNGVARLKNLD